MAHFAFDFEYPIVHHSFQVPLQMPAVNLRTQVLVVLNGQGCDSSADLLFSMFNYAFRMQNCAQKVIVYLKAGEDCW